MVNHHPAARNGTEAIQAAQLPRALLEAENLAEVVPHVEGLFFGGGASGIGIEKYIY